jgi:hypothetical protein
MEAKTKKRKHLTLAETIEQCRPKQMLELSDKQVSMLKNISQVTLAVAAVGGALAVAAVAPNVFKVLDQVAWANKTYNSWNRKRRDQARKIARSFYYLKKQGFIELTPAGDSFTVKLTRKGKKKIQQFKWQTLYVKKPASWNGRWWMVLADIPSDEYRIQANYFHQKLIQMEFYPMQRTVWVYPFDPREEINFVSTHFLLANFVTAVEVTQMDPEDEKKLTHFFKGKGIL